MFVGKQVKFLPGRNSSWKMKSAQTQHPVMVGNQIKFHHGTDSSWTMKSAHTHTNTHTQNNNNTVFVGKQLKFPMEQVLAGQ